MRTHIRQLFLILAFFTSISSLAAKQASDTLVVNFEKVPISFSGEFEGFNTSTSRPAVLAKWNNNDSAAFADANYFDAHWSIRNTLYVDSSDMNGKQNPIYWFRIKLIVDSTYVNHPMAVSFMGVGAMELFVDGQLKKAFGAISNDVNKKDTAIYLSSKPVLLTFDKAGVYQLAIRFQTNALDDEFGFGFEIMDANYFLASQHNTTIVLNIFVLGVGTVFITLFVVHLLFFLYYKKEKSNLYFAVFTLSVAAMFFSVYYFYYAVSSSAGPTFNILVNIFPLIASLALAAFTSYIFASNKWVLAVVILLGVATSLISIFDVENTTGVTSYLMLVFFLAVIIYTSVMFIRGMIKRMPGAFILGSGVLYLFLYLLGMLVVILTTGTINANYLIVLSTFLAIFGIPISISAYLAWQFSNTSKALTKELNNVAVLSSEKQQILESQNENLEIQVAERTRELQLEKQKSDDLLLNILPQEVAEELKEKGESKAQFYDEVSVLFTDFVNFTSVSERMGVDELLAELNANFTAFDQIMEKHNIEKIKTIGDAYLAVSGLPLSNAQHAQNAVAAALEIIAFVENRKKEVPYGLDIRIGIHTGALIAGIVGVKKFAYDIWGDTVNTAARMEQNSVPGRVNISASTFDLVKNEFDCEHRGKLAAKGKGEMDMYFVKKKSNIAGSSQ